MKVWINLMNSIFDKHTLMKSGDSFFCLFDEEMVSVFTGKKNYDVLFYEEILSVIWQKFGAKLFRLYFSSGLYPLLSLVRCFVGRRSVVVNLHATLAAAFPAGGTPVFSFTIAHTLLLLVCDGDNVTCEWVRPRCPFI